MVQVFTVCLCLLTAAVEDATFSVTLAGKHFANTLPEIKERAVRLADTLKKENFHLLKEEHSFPGFAVTKNNPSYQTKLVLRCEKNNEQQYRLFSAEISRNKKPNGGAYSVAGVSETFKPRGYSEFMQGYTLDAAFNDKIQFTSLDFADLDGDREITFDADEHISANRFTAYDTQHKEKRHRYRGIFEQEIREAPAAESNNNVDVNTVVIIPAALKYKNELAMLQRVEKCQQAIIAGKALPLLDHKAFFRPLVNSSIDVSIFYEDNRLAFVCAEDSETNYKVSDGIVHYLVGHFFIFDEQSRLQKYVDGDFDFDQNRVGKEVIETAKLIPKGSGTEITFHPTGYPATYKTIVKGNLFGRQMEWNDKGEVISDIDLDIPTAQKQKPVQKEKPVMRTWTSRGGKHTLQAKYISADENQVVLETEKDGEVVVKLSELSDEDRDYVKKQRE